MRAPPFRKFYPKDYGPVFRCYATSIVTICLEMYTCCLWKQPGGMIRVYVCYTEGPDLKINGYFFQECRNLTPGHRSHQRKRAKTSRSSFRRVKASSRAAPGMSAATTSTDADSEAVQLLIDGLLLASISSGLLS